MEGRTFAYLMLAGNVTQRLQQDLAEWYFGDIIEAFAEAEDQAAGPADIWSFGWEEQFTRIAPVQLTIGLDVRPLLLEAMLSPIVRLEHEDINGGGSIYVFSGPYDATPDLDASRARDDQTRFTAVLSATVRLALRNRVGVLFVGGWGWYYEMEIPRKQQRLLKNMNMLFTTRHV